MAAFQPTTVSVAPNNYLPTDNGRPDKTKLTLDFNQTPKKNDAHNNPCFLDSPDMQMLKVDSPELEKMILDNFTGDTSTPTPTQFVNPKNIIRGDPQTFPTPPPALSVPVNIYSNISTPIDDSRSKLQGTVGTTNSQRPHAIVAPVQYTVSSMNVSQKPENTATFVVTKIPSSTSQRLTVNKACLLQPTSTISIAIPPSTTQNNMYRNNGYYTPNCLSEESLRIKTEPSSISSFSDSAPSSSTTQEPVQMLTNPVLQEQIKQERKRLRNRIAATKCRKRKLEKISTLEDQVNDLKQSNSDLNQRKMQLRDQIAILKQKMLAHLKSGCQVHVAPNVQSM